MYHLSHETPFLVESRKHVKEETLFSAVGPVACHSTLTVPLLTLTPSLTRWSEQTLESTGTKLTDSEEEELTQRVWSLFTM